MPKWGEPISDVDMYRAWGWVLIFIWVGDASARFGGSGTHDTGVRRDICYLGARYVAGLPTLVLPSAPDPLLRGKFLNRYKLAQRSFAAMTPEETQLDGTARKMRSLTELRPETSAALGIAFEENGTVLRRPPPEGLNHRVGLLRARGWFEDNGLMAYEDHSLAGAGHVEFARKFINNQFPMAAAGMETEGNGQLWLHYHDFDSHAFGYYLMPRFVVERSQARLRFLLGLLDNPRVSDKANAKTGVEAAIRREVQGWIR